MHPRFRILFSAALIAAAFFAVPAAAQDALYTVPNVHVDAGGSSSTEALNAAITQGRGRAFQVLFRRLTRQADWNRQPALDAAALLRISRGYTIANERRSTTRYVADVTYMFNPNAVAQTLRAANIAFSRTTAKPILVIPMSPGVSRGPWAQALMAPGLQQGSTVPFTVSGAESDGELAGLNFETAGYNDVAAVASRNRVTEVALVQAVYANGKMTVNIRRLGLGETPARVSVDVPMVQTVSTTYPAAAQAAVRTIEDMWKTRTAVDFTQRGRLTADVRIASLAQWGELQTQLAAISTVTGMTVSAMTVGYARVNLTYVGGTEQLREAFAGAGLSLTNRGGQWTLARAGQ
jgi:hypothetical protein